MAIPVNPAGSTSSRSGIEQALTFNTGGNTGISFGASRTLSYALAATAAVLVAGGAWWLFGRKK